MNRTMLTVGILAAGTWLVGCKGESPSNAVAPADQAAEDHGHEHHDHDHHDHGHDHHAHDAPETLQAAVGELTELRDNIANAFASDDLKTADTEVHEVGHLLEALDSLAEKAELTEEQVAAVKQAQQSLFEEFAALDRTLHDKSDGKTWEEVSEKVNQAIADLQAVVPAAKEGSE